MSADEHRPASAETLAEEARLWDSGALRPSDWFDAPEAVPRIAESLTVSITMSKRMLAVPGRSQGAKALASARLRTAGCMSES